MFSTGRCFSATLFIVNMTLGCAAAQTLDQAVAQLGAQIASNGTTKSGLSLDIENISSLPAPEVVKVRDALQLELKRDGLSFDSNSLALIQVTISENARGFLLLAQTPSGDGMKVSMAPWTLHATQTPVARAAIGKTLVLEHPAPVLDIAVTNNGTELWLLEPARLVHFTRAGESWVSDRNNVITPAKPLPRDLRGRLNPDPRLPDSGSAWALDARHTVHWIPGRNFFADESGEFYSIANVGKVEFKAGLDGRTRMTTSDGQLIGNIDDWGSDIVAVQGSCGEWFVLPAAKTERDGPDHLQAFQVTEGMPIASGEALEFSGPITALWPSETPAQATVVVRNGKAGKYEVYRVAIACG